MSEQDDVLTPLPHRARFAIQAFRKVKPSPELESRIFDALDAERPPERARSSKPRSRGLKRPLTFAIAMAGLFALGTLAVVALRGTPQAELPPASTVADAHHLSVKIPEEGDAWVELPLATHHHDPHMVTVHFDAPASVKLHVPDASSSADRETDCSEHRCVHRWRASAHAARHSPPRVQIKTPGRYEFRVKHTSHARSYDEHFVVLATR